MTFHEYMIMAQTDTNRPPEQRRGQFMFNLLVVFRSDLADQIRTTDKDPFYDNDLIPAMIAWLAEHWTE